MQIWMKTIILYQTVECLKECNLARGRKGWKVAGPCGRLKKSIYDRWWPQLESSTTAGGRDRAPASPVPQELKFVSLWLSQDSNSLTTHPMGTGKKHSIPAPNKTTLPEANLIIWCVASNSQMHTNLHQFPSCCRWRCQKQGTGLRIYNRCMSVSLQRKHEFLEFLFLSVSVNYPVCRYQVLPSKTPFRCPLECSDSCTVKTI